MLIQVAKFLLVVCWLCFAVDVEQLLGAVDWVLDPANNRITYVYPNTKVLPNNHCKSKAAIKFGAGSEWAKKAVYNLMSLCRICVLSDKRSFALFPAANQDTTIPEEDRKSIPLRYCCPRSYLNVTQAKILLK